MSPKKANTNTNSVDFGSESGKGDDSPVGEQPLTQTENQLEDVAPVVTDRGPLSSFQKLLDELRDQDLDFHLPLSEGESAAMESEVRVWHNFSTLHRAIEAVFHTDIVMVSGRYPERLLAQAKGQQHTRIFEAVGDYIPNLAYFSTKEGKVRFTSPQWKSMTYKDSRVRVTGTSFEVSKGWTRYRTLVGKVVDVYTGKVLNPPPFLAFKQAPYLNGLSLPAYKQGLTEEEIEECGSQSDTPLTVPELFARAVAKAGSVEKLSVTYHRLPAADELGSSSDAEKFIQLRRGASNVKFPDSVGSYKLAVDMMTVNLQKNSPEVYEKSALPRLAPIIKELSEEEAKFVYFEVKKLLVGFPALEPEDPVQFWESDELMESETVVTQLHISGTPKAVVAHVRQEHNVPMPLYLAPSNCSKDLDQLMQVVPYICHNGARLVNAVFHEGGEVYAPSVTPRRVDDRGVGAEGFLWYERMSCSIYYDGLLLLPRPGAELHVIDWCTAVNTALVHNLLSLGPSLDKPVVRRIQEPLNWPLPTPPAYFNGMGPLRDRLILSPYILNKEVWRKEGLNDSRMLLPSDELLKVVERDDVRLCNAHEFLTGQGPLLLELIKQGRTLPATHMMKISFDEEDNIHVDFGESKSLLPSAPASLALPPRSESAAPEAPAKSKKREVPELVKLGNFDIEVSKLKPVKVNTGSNVDPLGIPASRENAAWHLKSDSIPKYGAASAYSQTTSSPPTWGRVRELVADKLVSEEVFRNLYSVCWLAANVQDDILAPHPAVSCVNPQFVSSLKDEPFPYEVWSFPTGKLGVPNALRVNDQGCTPLSPEDLALIKRKERKNARRGNVTGYGGGGGYGFVPAPPQTQPLSTMQQTGYNYGAPGHPAYLQPPVAPGPAYPVPGPTPGYFGQPPSGPYPQFVEGSSRGSFGRGRPPLSRGQPRGRGGPPIEHPARAADKPTSWAEEVETDLYTESGDRRPTGF